MSGQTQLPPPGQPGPGEPATATTKSGRPLWRKKRFLIPVGLLALLVVIGVATSGDDDPAELAAAEEPADTEPAGGDADGDGADEVSDNNAVGDTVSMGDLDHTLHGARFYEGDEFLTPDDGERWLLVDIELTNNGDESAAISSMIMWRLVDHDNRSRDLAITGDERGSLDGELGAGRSLRGEIAYSVDEGQDGWELLFEPDLFGFGQAIYDLSAGDVD